MSKGWGIAVFPQVAQLSQSSGVSFEHTETISRVSRSFSSSVKTYKVSRFGFAVMLTTFAGIKSSTCLVTSMAVLDTASLLKKYSITREESPPSAAMYSRSPIFAGLMSWVLYLVVAVKATFVALRASSPVSSNCWPALVRMMTAPRNCVIRSMMQTSSAAS